MTRDSKTGIVLILIGLCFPLALLPFVSGYAEGAGFINNLLGLKIMVSISEKFKGGIPYRFFIAFGVILVFIGLRRCFDRVKDDGAGNQDSE